MPSFALRGLVEERRWGRRPSAEFLVLSVLAVVAAIVITWNDFGVVTPLTKPEVFLAPWQAGARYASVWSDSPNLGTASFNVGLAPIAWLFGVLESIGWPAWLAMRVWSTGILVIGAWGIRRLYVDLTHGTSADTAAARVAVAVLWVANPYTVVGGGTLPTNLPYHLLPWFVLFLLRGARSPGWRWAAASALVLAAMSGINAGVVPALQLVSILPVALHVLIIERLGWRSLAAQLVRTGALYLAMSLYWLVPSLLALRVGSAIASTTESLEAINSANSFTEVLRGLGLWTLYGRGPEGPFQPGYQSYLTAPVIVVASFGPVVLAALGARLSRAPARLLAMTALATGALVMVGSHPFANRTTWGSLQLWLLENVPGLIALRTTNKAGAVLMLGMAILGGLAVAEIVPRLATRPVRALAAFLAGVMVTLAVWPAFNGTLYEFRLPIPDYWEQASRAVNDSGVRADQRVLIVPGIHLADYDWGYAAPDELGQSLLRPEHAFRTTIPNGSPYSANLLGAVDRALLSDDAPPGTISTLAGMIGASEVLARYDVQTLSSEAGALVETNLSADAGLGREDGFGPAARASASAITLRPVMSDPSVLALHPGNRAVVVDGDADAVTGLVSSGLLGEASAMLYAGDITPDTLRTAVKDGAGVVLTDTNQRRAWSSLEQTRLGPLVSDDESAQGSLALFGAGGQTVVTDAPGVKVTVAGQGLLFGPFEDGDPRRALDGDRTTTWRFGNFSSGAGNAMTISLAQPRRVPALRLQPAQDGGNLITKVLVRTAGPAGAWSKVVELGPWAAFPTSVELPESPISSVTVEVTAVSGSGIGPVGFSEISLDGVDLRPTVRMPVDLVRELGTWTGPDLQALQNARLDILMERHQGGRSDADEGTLRRSFGIPTPREFEVRGTLRLAAGASDVDLLQLQGLTDAVTTRASSRAFNNLDVRAAKVLDGTEDSPLLSTAWVPGGSVIGEWIRFAFPARQLDGFDITQSEAGAFASRVLVSVNDQEPMEVSLWRGRSHVALPDVGPVDRVSVLITAVEGEGLVQFRDISLPRPERSGAEPLECATVALVDARPLRARIAERSDDLLAGQSVPLEVCDGAALRLSSGDHTIVSAGPFTLDSLHLSSPGTRIPGPNPPQAKAVAIERTATRTSLTVSGTCDPCWLRAGIGYGSGWDAKVAGRTLGDPVVVDGYSLGWRLSAADGDRIDVTYRPAAWAMGAWVASLVAILGAFAVILRSRRMSIAAPGFESAPAARTNLAGRRTAGRAPCSRGLAGSVLGLVVALIAGPLVGVVAGAVGFVYARRPRVLLSLGFALIASLVPAWFLGSSASLTDGAARVAENRIAWSLAALGLGLLTSGVICEAVRGLRREEVVNEQ